MVATAPSSKVRRKLRNAIPKASKLMDLWRLQLRNLATDAGILDRNEDYARFILLGRSRTGSNLLRSLLNAHSQVITFGEIFRESGAIGWDFGRFPQSGRTLSLIQSDPVRFLETSVFGNYPGHIGAAGFKLFYYHAHDDGWEPIWGYLRNQKALKIIHVKRRNILKTILSRKRAMEANAWVRRDSADSSDGESIFLSYEECLEAFTQTRAWEQQYDAFFGNHDKIDLVYENLSRDMTGEMKRVQAFLGIDYEALEPSTAKQSRQPLHRTIQNYNELKERFVGTPWEEFFE